MCVETSCKDARYNCIAWALGFNHVRMWPDKKNITMVWPRPKPDIITVREFSEVFALFGYAEDKIEFEIGYEKIALYLENDQPEHAARQHPQTGKWLAKLGGGVDVEQDHLRDFPLYEPYSGGAYNGTPKFYYKRKAGLRYPTFEEVAAANGVWPPPPRILTVYEAAG